VSGAVDVKSWFFDSHLVEARVSLAVRQAMSKFGAFTRQSAKQSLKYGDRHSPAGSPPTVHRTTAFDRYTKSGKLRPTSPLKELIYFSYDDESKSVVVGPLAFSSRPSTVPQVLEHSGLVPQHRNKRRRIRRLGGSGEIRISGTGKNTKAVVGRDGRTFQVTYAKLTTPAQVQRANMLNELLYGPEFFKSRSQAARPFMGPAAEKNMAGVSALLQASVK
jgi:hypothetical protein